MRLAVFDVDGVLADVAHRRHHVDGPRRDWAAFFAAAGADPLLAAGASRLRRAVQDGMLPVYLSGRPERLRAVTTAWLAHHELPAADLVLRADGDHSPAVDFKLDRLRLVASTFTIGLLVDDDPQVVAAVRRHRPQLVDEVEHATWQDARAARTLHRAQDDGAT